MPSSGEDRFAEIDVPVKVVETEVPAQLNVGAIGSTWLKRPLYETAGSFGAIEEPVDVACANA
jgi:hypothetical protein